MKNMKKLLRKAMVFTLTAAMLVGTPLTASAAGLVDLYQSEDALANTDSDQKSGTGTGTGTGSKGLSELPADLLGIYLDNTSLEVEHPQEGSLTVAFTWSTGKEPEAAEQKKLLENIKWESSNPEVIAVGKTAIDEGNKTNTVALAPKLPGTATVTASLSSKDGKSMFAQAAVTVIRYADKLTFKEAELKEEACVGNTINLDDYVERYVKDDGIFKLANTSDVLVFSLKTEVKNSATLKNGVLALKKAGKIKILAVGQKKGDKVGTGWLELNVENGTNVKKITFKDGNKQTFLVNDGMTKAVTALIEKADDGNCKNRITWTSKKPAVVEVVAKDGGAAVNLKLEKGSEKTPESTVTLVAKSAGKAQIEAKASNGKKATLTVTVSANLTDIKIEKTEVPGTLYSGQTIDLYDSADQYFKANGDVNFTDAGLKWTFDGTPEEQKAAKKVASINAKGVLTIKPSLTYKDKGQEVTVEKIKVKAVNAKKIATSPAVAAGKLEDAKCGHAEFKLEQVSIDTITVTRNVTVHASVARNTTTNKVKQDKKVADTVAAGETVTYTLKAEGTKKDGSPLSDEEARAALGWISSNTKVAKASKNAENYGVVKAIKKGKANITVNSATYNTKTKKYVAIKATFQDNVTAPTKTLTLSIKNKGIVAPKKQTITIKPVIEKGSTTKNNGKDIKWSVTSTTSTKISIDDKGKIKNVNLTEADLGKEIVVTARVENGPSATIVLPIVKKSTNVKFFDKNDNATKKVTLAMSPDDENKEEFNETVTVKINKALPGAEDGKVSTVSYTVNKPGIVRIKDLGNGQLQINAVSNGTVKITATTLDGAKANLTVKVSNVTYAAKFWKQNQ